ncbi:MAG: OB-fold domain-containing protein [Eubacteriales bacterium]
MSTNPRRPRRSGSGRGWIRLFCSAMTLKRLRAGQKERLYTHLHLAEGIMALYGFYEPEEKDMFRRLLTVTRVGPKLALSVLSVLTPSDVAGAIHCRNATRSS